jgi:hypothetical protein
MKLITKAIAKKLPARYSQENESDPICSLKFFTPDSSWTWYVLEGEEEENGDWTFFGKVVSNLCPEGELGYFTLSELKKVRGSLRLPIERDMYFSPEKISECK